MTILFAGGEDLDFAPIGTVSVVTTAGYFRPGFARCGLYVPVSTSSGWAALNAFNASSVWLGCRAYNPYASTSTSGSSTYASDVVLFLDANGATRLVIRNSSSATASMASSFIVQKVNAGGTRTQIGGTFSAGFSAKPSVPDKLDVAVNYAAAGSITVYIAGLQVFSYSGDVTTDGVTSLAGFILGSLSNGNASVAWSEAVVATTDTRTLSLVTYAPNALGTTTQWNGTAASVAEITLNDGDGIDTAAAGNVEEIVTTGTLPAGATYSVAAVVAAARAATNPSAPQHLDLGVTIGGTDYWSSDLSVGSAFGRATAGWATNPATGAVWTQADLAALGIAVKAVA